MQTQQQKTATKQRLSVGEVVVAILNLLLGSVFAISCYGFALTRVPHSWQDYVLSGIMAVATVGTGLTALLLALRQRTLAVYFQWLAVLALLTSALVTLWDALDHHVGPDSLLIVTGIPLLITLLLAWSAWFLKRMDDNK